MTRSKFEIPIAYGIDWSNGSLSLPKRKELDVDLLNAVIGIAEAFGAKDVQVDTVIDDPNGRGKVVTLSANGSLDMEALQSSLRRAINGFE